MRGTQARGIVLDGQKLRERRRARGWTQAVLADAATEVSIDTISRAEHGQSISLENAIAIAGALEVDLAALCAEQRSIAVSNITVRVPRHFMGRDEALAQIENMLAQDERRVAITALHGLRGVGKTALAATYAELHRDDFRATWWVRAETEQSLRADIVGLGVRLGWVAPDEKEEQALSTVSAKLQQEGDGILLIYDNALGPNVIRTYLPPRGAARIIITSNAPTWRGIAEPVEIAVWPKDIGADFLIARTGRTRERAAAEHLSEALGGLPLAHEQAAAYCERLGIAIAEYRSRFEATPIRLLDAQRDIAHDYGRTVAKTFALAIEEAAKLHPAAEPLIVHAALLAPEPIPLFLFTEAREKFGERLASMLAADGLDEAIAALRAFALVDRQIVRDDRHPTIAIDTIRLHRLVRQVAASQWQDARRGEAQRTLVMVMASAYPRDVGQEPKTWPRARQLDALAYALVGDEATPLKGVEGPTSLLLGRLGEYRLAALAAYGEARSLCERALTICEKTLGPDHPDTATSLNNLALVLTVQGNFDAARPLIERALAINEQKLGDHPSTAAMLNNLAVLCEQKGDFTAARSIKERALAICEKIRGPDHPETAINLNNLGFLLQKRGNLAAARPLFERALVIREAALGSEHPDTASTRNNLGFLLQTQGDLTAAQQLHERALAIREKMLGPEHPDTATSLNNLGLVLYTQGNLTAARSLHERALAMREKMLGPEHPDTAVSLSNLGNILWDQGDLMAARSYFERVVLIHEKVWGPEHPDTATSLNNLGLLLRTQGDLTAAQVLLRRALTVCEAVLGPDHPHTATTLNNLADLLYSQNDLAAAYPLVERSLAIKEKALGPEHIETATGLNNLAIMLCRQGDFVAARPLLERALAIFEKTLGPDHPSTTIAQKHLAMVLKPTS